MRLTSERISIYRIVCNSACYNTDCRVLLTLSQPLSLITTLQTSLFLPVLSIKNSRCPLMSIDFWSVNSKQLSVNRLGGNAGNLSDKSDRRRESGGGNDVNGSRERS